MQQTTDASRDGSGTLKDEQVSTAALVDNVIEDDRLSPAEKESAFHFSKCEDRVSVYTEEAGLMRRLLQHPKFVVESLRITTAESWGQRIDVNDFQGGSITGVEGSVPIGALSVKTSTRTTSQHAAIVSEAVLRRN
jgi:hypothetical protein